MRIIFLAIIIIAFFKELNCQISHIAVDAELLDKRVLLRWQVKDGIKNARIEIYRNEGSGYLKIGDRPSAKDEFIDYKTTPGKTYLYFVKMTDTVSQKVYFSDTIAIKPVDFSDEEFLEMVQKYCFRFFWECTNPENGITADRLTPEGPSSWGSIAATGFALTAYAVGVERGWITRKQAVERVLKTLRWFWNAPQGNQTSGKIGFRGWFYHFLNLDDGLRADKSELSTIDTALLLLGILFCREYFNADTPEEREIRMLADSIYFRVDFAWATTPEGGISRVWYPEWNSEKPSDESWYGYNEMMALYILALGSPTKPTINPNAWEIFAKEYESHWKKFYLYEHLSFPPLFGHQYSHIWIDFRGIKDKFMRKKEIDYFENSKRATYENREYCIRNPKNFKGYHALSWGITASDCPIGYCVRGAPGWDESDDGTITPTAPGGSVPFAPEICIPTLRFMYDSIKVGETYLWDTYGFRDAYNLTANWIASDYLGIDQGPILLMIENYRTGLIWNYMRKSPYIISGLKKAGFTGGWLYEQNSKQN